MYAASALAANTVARSAAGAAAPLFTNYMFDALGVGPGGSLIAGVGCLLAPAPFLFYKYGRAIRERSKFAPTAPPKPAEGEKKGEEAADERRGSNTSDEEYERELDEEMGVPDKDFEKTQSKSSAGSPTSPEGDENGDRFLDASGLEKAENTTR